MKSTFARVDSATLRRTARRPARQAPHHLVMQPVESAFDHWIRSRLVKPSATRTAPITASVPEFAKRIFSMLGHIFLMRRTTSASMGVENPHTVPMFWMASMTAASTWSR